MRMVEQNGRKRLGLCCRHGASQPDLTCQPFDPGVGLLLNTGLALVQCNGIGVCTVSSRSVSSYSV